MTTAKTTAPIIFADATAWPDAYTAVDGRFHIQETTESTVSRGLSREGFEVTDEQGDPDWHPWAADLDGIRAIIARVLDAETTPLPERGDSDVHPIPDTSVYRTADNRFTAHPRHDYRGKQIGYTVIDHRPGLGVPLDFGVDGNIHDVRRQIVKIVERDYRDARLAYTARRAATDPAWAAKVAELRRTAAATGRASGSTGAYRGEDGDTEFAGALVYVPRDEYAAVLDAPAPAPLVRPSVVDLADRQVIVDYLDYIASRGYQVVHENGRKMGQHAWTSLVHDYLNQR